MTQPDCYYCKHLDFDTTEDDEYSFCKKGHELLLSMNIPDDCKDFEEGI